VEDDPPTTEELRAVQRDREASERDAAHDASTEAGERAHRRRADKAAYLEERLAEQQRALEGDEE
jgi:hypothetical protein